MDSYRNWPGSFRLSEGFLIPARFRHPHLRKQGKNLNAPTTAKSKNAEERDTSRRMSVRSGVSKAV